jgi:glycosyltransferase involved in cell wall biosynthesis
LVLITIVTVNLNNIKGLRQTVDSILGQNFKNFEFIIIDGESIDGSIDYITHINDNRIQYIIESDHGIYDAMNKGIDKSTADYVLFLNSGDTLCNEFVLSNVLLEIAKEPNFDCYYGQEMQVGSNIQNIKSVDIDERLSFLLYDSIPHQASFWKRKVLLDLGKFDIEYKIIGDFVLLYKGLVLGKRFYKMDLIVDFFELGGISNDVRFKTQWKRDLVLFKTTYLFNLNKDITDFLKLKNNNKTVIRKLKVFFSKANNFIRFVNLKKIK